MKVLEYIKICLYFLIILYILNPVCVTILGGNILLKMGWINEVSSMIISLIVGYLYYLLWCKVRTYFKKYDGICLEVIGAK